jgi:hypothetical protein
MMLDEDDCAIAPRTILAHRAESEVRRMMQSKRRSRGSMELRAKPLQPLCTQVVPLASSIAHMLALSAEDAVPVTMQFCNRSHKRVMAVSGERPHQARSFQPQG